MWADTVIKTIDFTDTSSWSGASFSQGASDDPVTINGVTFNEKSASYDFSWSAGKLTFPNTNMTENNYALGFPVTGIVGGIVIIKVYNGTDACQVKYAIKDGGTAFNASDLTSGTSAPTYSTPCTIINTGLSDSKAYIYIGRHSSSYKTITKIEVLTVGLTDLSESSFYQFYKSGYVNVATLISGASLPSYIFHNIGTNENTNANSSEVSSPHDFSGLSSASSSTYYYRLKTSNSNTLAIGALSHVKSIRLYGNGSGADGTIRVNVIKVSGSGEAMNINIDYDNSKQTVLEYSTGDLSIFDEYDSDTYYFYIITFAKKSSSSTNFSLWGLYIEYYTPSSYTVSYNANGGSGDISDDTGASIDLSDGSGFTPPSANYSFAGWNTDEHGTGTSYSSGQTGVKADLTLYAVWTQNGTIDANGGSAAGAYTATYNKAGIEITTAPTNAGYAIKGYYEAGTGDALVATTAGALQTSTTYTDASGYWTHTGATPTLYTQWENTHELTVNVNDADMGSAEAEETTIAEGSTTSVTATANSGYKFRNWTVSGTGATLTSTTDNPTTLTMGSTDATVTASFSALEHYTITYNKGEHGSGDAIANGDKTEDADFTLSSSTYTYAGHLQTGWATTDGGEKAYELGGTYTANAKLDLYPYWIEQYTLTFDANGGSGNMADIQGSGATTLTANAYTKSGFTFLGWATSQANADARTVEYDDKADYTLNADATLYAVWGENYCELKPETSGSISYGDPISMQSGSYGGVMTAVGSGLSYESNGLKFGNSADKPVVTLNDYLKEGSVIIVTLKAGGNYGRGLDLYSFDGKNKITSFSFPSDNDISITENSVKTFQYTVTSSDKLKDTNGFQLWRYAGNTWLQSLAVIDCQPGGVISASGWNTYSSNKKLDLSTISGGTAYVATTIDGSSNSVKLKECEAIVNAEEGLMIKGVPGASFTINPSSDDATLSETNLMVGLPNGGSAPVGSYVFGWPTANPEGFGFYYVNSSAATLGAGKAYLSVPTPIGSRLSISFDNSTTTGVQELKVSNSEAYYNLHGQRVNAPQKGIYIVNGKKFINK